MTDMAIIYAIGGFFLVSVGSAFAVSSGRHQQDLREYLEPELRRCGVEFVSAAYPGMFKVGPFPKFEFERGRPQSTVGGTRGEYCEYRIVCFKDSRGTVYRLWALVEFEMFQFRRVRWRAEQRDCLPSSVLQILEN